MESPTTPSQEPDAGFTAPDPALNLEPAPAPALFAQPAELPRQPKRIPSHLIGPLIVGGIVLAIVLIMAASALVSGLGRTAAGVKQPGPPSGPVRTLTLPASVRSYAQETGSTAASLIAIMRKRANSQIRLRNTMWAGAFQKAAIGIYTQPGGPPFVVIGFSRRTTPLVFEVTRSQPLAVRVDSFLLGAHVSNARAYPAGPLGGVLSCGTQQAAAVCVWADSSTLATTFQSGVSPGDLASLTVALRDAAEH